MGVAYAALHVADEGSERAGVREGWTAAYEAHRDELLRRSLGWTAALTGAGLLAGVCLALYAQPPDLGVQSSALGAAAAIAASFAIVARQRRVGAGIRPLAIAWVLLITLAEVAYFELVPAGITLAEGMFVTHVLGLAILMPWTAAAQAWASLCALVAYGGYFAKVPTLADASLISMCVSAVAISIVGTSRTWRAARLRARAGSA